jgi:glycosyltransferase involved in cell wall biosynthesis
MTRVALVHDYLTQRGGAERVALTMLDAFPGAPLYTSLYEPDSTFPEFAAHDIRTLPLNAIGVLRRHHRFALPFLAPAFSSCRIDADVVVCSTSGWAHGVRASGRKLVYCHNPARWLYQREEYLGAGAGVARTVLAPLRPALARWDKHAALSADRYLVNSSAVRDRVRAAYGIEARVLPPPARLTPDGPISRGIDGIAPGFLLCISRLLRYKNVDAAIDAVEALPDARLVIVGSGPDEARLRARAPSNVRLLGMVRDEDMRWLYSSCSALVAPSYEDFGLTPIEAASFGKATVALRYGGFIDTIVEGQTGVFAESPTGDAVRAAIGRLRDTRWDRNRLRSHAAEYSTERFVEELQAEAEKLRR